MQASVNDVQWCEERGACGVTFSGSAATGEPPLCMSYALVTALRQAIASARSDAGNDQWFDMSELPGCDVT